MGWGFQFLLNLKRSHFSFWLHPNYKQGIQTTELICCNPPPAAEWAPFGRFPEHRWIITNKLSGLDLNARSGPMWNQNSALGSTAIETYSPTASISELPVSSVSDFKTKQGGVSPQFLTAEGTQPHGVRISKNLIPELNPYGYHATFLCCFARHPNFAAEIFLFLSWLLFITQILCYLVKLHLHLLHFPSDNFPLASSFCWSECLWGAWLVWSSWSAR